MVERQAENLEVVRSIRPVGILIFDFNGLLEDTSVLDFDEFDTIGNNYCDEFCFSKPLEDDIFFADNYRSEFFFCRKRNFFNPYSDFNKVTVIRKSIKKRSKINKYFLFLRNFFSRVSFNKTTKQKTPIFLTYLLLYFLITHDLYFFCKKLTNFLQKTDRRFQFKIVRHFKLLNRFAKLGLFSYFGVSGVYFRVSGKFGGVGGSKKLRKTLVWSRPGFSDRSLRIQRSINTVWSLTGTTTWSIYASYM